MYRIRLHGRGGHGIKTASRILGSAFFHEGFEVQDAPRYGAERRGAPIFASVRAGRGPIHERGAIGRPDLVVVADDTLVRVAVAGVLLGLDERSVLLIRSRDDAATWSQRLPPVGRVVVLSPDAGSGGAGGEDTRFAGTACAGAAARLVGVISRAALEDALGDELVALREPDRIRSRQDALAAWDGMAEQAGCVSEGPELRAAEAAPPGWVDVPFDDARRSAPDVHGAATSVQVRTGLWRSLRPVVDLERCRRCHWICSTLCPDGVIAVEPDGAPQIDYDHCKGCMVCVAVCPSHAIAAVPEAEASRADDGRVPT